MTEVKDPEIMLFGKRISIPPSTVAECDELEQQKRLFFPSKNSLVPKTTSADTVGDEKEDNKKSSQSELTATRLKDPATSSDHNPKTPSFDKEHYNNVEQSETSVSQEQTLKKPDKIVPCPRCSSMDTKFCYYNNYNVSQPRHFCKNCQRYWTAGGSMRNVPVGSGRRKNKNPFSASHYQHIMGSEANGIHYPNSRTDGTILTFGSDSRHCDSASFPLNMAEKSHRIPVGGEEFSESDSAEKGGNSGFEESVMKNSQNFPGQIPCFSMPPWSAFPPPAFSPPGFPVQFYQTQPYWGGCSLPGPWNVPWFFPSNPNCSTLGKHSREGEMLTRLNSEKEEPLKQNDSERGVWIPKTLRIHDPSEAAKSSIWSTLGTKNEKNYSINGGGLFKSFQSKVDERNHQNGTSIALHANPAALSRSLNFHESA